MHRKKYLKQWHIDHKEQRKQYLSLNKEKIKVQIRNAAFKRIYNLSYEDWLAMWEEQEGKCAICGKAFESPSDACVDHNHETDEVRGLLCHHCNRGLGSFRDDIELLEEAIEYLSNRE